MKVLSPLFLSSKSAKNSENREEEKKKDTIGDKRERKKTRCGEEHT